MSKVITPNQAAEIIGCDDATIRRLIIRKQLRGKKLSNGFYVLNETDVRKFKLIYSPYMRSKKVA